MDTTSGGDARGRDNAAKNVDGRKRQIVVDSMGLLMAVMVMAASVDDGVAAQELFARQEGQPMTWVRKTHDDTKYYNINLYEWVEANVNNKVAIIRRAEEWKGWVNCAAIHPQVSAPLEACPGAQARPTKLLAAGQAAIVAF